MLDRGLDLEQLARDAVASGADCLAMAGGDGSQALVASIAIEHNLPFVCVSAGTRNHFALDLGIDREDPRKSLDAFRDGIERRIDYRDSWRSPVRQQRLVRDLCHDRPAAGLSRREVRDHQGAPSGDARADEEPFDLQFNEPDGTEVQGAFLIQVSNNPYVLGATLDSVAAPTPRYGETRRRRHHRGKREAAQVVTLSALGQRRRSRHWHEEFATERLEVGCRDPEKPLRASTVRPWRTRNPPHLRDSSSGSTAPGTEGKPDRRRAPPSSRCLWY